MASRRTGLDRQQGRRPCRQTGGHLVRLGGVGAGLLLELRVGHQFDVDGYGEGHLRAGQDEERKLSTTALAPVFTAAIVASRPGPARNPAATPPTPGGP